MDQLITRRVDFGERAPITEALIDIRTVMAEEVGLEALRGFNDLLGGAYPQVRTQTELAGQIRLAGDETSMAARHGLRGFIFASRDGHQVVQARRDGFTYSLLHPYRGWNALRDEAKRLWHRYVDVARPSQASRLAVRYINRLPVPSDGFHLEDWVSFHPNVPVGLGSMADFAMKVVLPHPHVPQYSAIVTLGIAPPNAQEETPGLMLDIDVFTSAQLPPTEDEIWDTLEDLRVFKNDIFFGTITMRTEERLLA